VAAATAAGGRGRMKVNGTGRLCRRHAVWAPCAGYRDGFITRQQHGPDGGSRRTWTMNHPEKVKDWGLRAHYYVATAGRR